MSATHVTLVDFINAVGIAHGFALNPAAAQHGEFVFDRAVPGAPGCVVRLYSGVAFVDAANVGKAVRVCAVDTAANGGQGAGLVKSFVVAMAPTWAADVIAAATAVEETAAARAAQYGCALKPAAPAKLTPPAAAVDPATFAFPTVPTKAAAVAWMRESLADPAWAVWGLLTVFAYQTAQEQSAEQTSEDNGVGFTGTDGEILTSFAKQYKAKGYLSPKQLGLLVKKMPKYAGQLLKHLAVQGTGPVVDKKACAAA